MGSSDNNEALTTVVFSPSLRGRLAHVLWLYAENAKRALLARRHRKSVNKAAEAIGEKLLKSGLEIGDASRYLSQDGYAALQQSSELIFTKMQSREIQTVLEMGRNERQGKDYLIHMIPGEERHDENSPYLRLALDPMLLEIVSTYFGMFPQLHSIGSWLNFPTPEEAKKSQLWHRDPADLKLLKVFIYLEPVGEENGPFTFIPETQPFGAASHIVPPHEHVRRVTDEEMASAIPENKWVKCMGPANTMVLADTVGFHRGGKVESGRRLLITLTYTSGRPRETRQELNIPGVPSWATLPIQKCALEGVVGG